MSTRYSEFDITTIPQGVKFSFSSTTGILRREADATPIVRIEHGERGGLFGRSPYTVIDSATGTALAVLNRRGSSWEISKPTGEAIGEVVPVHLTIGFSTYVATAGGTEVCHYTWAYDGVMTFAAELSLRFVAGTEALLDRAVAVALAPLLERQVRRGGQGEDSIR